jgi:hypothetical protein
MRPQRSGEVGSDNRVLRLMYGLRKFGLDLFDNLIDAAFLGEDVVGDEE